MSANLAAATLAVALTWIISGLALVGVGFASRQAVARAFRHENERSVRPADMWIGLGVLTAYLEIWNLFAGVTNKTLVAPAAVAASAGVVLLRRRARAGGSATISRQLLLRIGALAFAIVWLANLALGRPRSWDSGLYHFPAIEYAVRFPAIPGLANLQERLGAGDAHLLFVALLGNGPWRNAGFHLANGLLVVLLLVHILWRLSERNVAPVSRGIMLLLIPATFATVAADPGGRLSSPSLDLPAFILVAAGFICLCETLEEFQLAPAMGATTALATAAATRPQFFPALILAGMAVAIASKRRLQALVVAGAIPIAIAAAWAARQSILSGYPFLPLKVGALPVDWRVPGDAVDTMNAWVRSWARAPHEAPHSVLASWNWFPAWLGRVTTDIDVIPPLVLSLLAIVRIRARGRDLRLLFMLLSPLLLTLLLWFFTAPDPRFVYGPLWLVPITLLAWQRLDEVVGIVSVGAAVIALLVGGAWHPTTALGDGPFDSVEPPVPPVRLVRTDTGLAIKRPLRDDRCWRLMLCAPVVNRHLRERGAGVASGFRVSGDSSADSTTARGDSAR